MPPTLEQLGIDKLSVADRLELIGAIWDSIAQNPEQFEIPEWHKRELDEEIAAFEANPDDCSTWEEVKARLKARK